MSALVQRLASCHRRLEELANEGAWGALGGALAERDALLAELAPAERERALIEARRRTAELTALAVTARRECAQALKSLRQGRRAATRYVTVQRNVS